MTTEEIATPKDLGFGMVGMGAPVMRWVDHVCTEFGAVTYVEIGVALGQTLMAIANRLRAKAQTWRAIGVELPEGYSFRKKDVIKNAHNERLRLEIITAFPKPVNPKWDQVTLCLKDGKVFLAESFAPEGRVHLALIDACHSKKCATADFLAIEPFIPTGGIVMFHDFGTDQTGIDQPWCEPFDVHGACEDLGLLDGTRADWRFLEQIESEEGSGDMGVFQKL